MARVIRRAFAPEWMDSGAQEWEQSKGADGHFSWIDDECAGYQCECGRELMLNISTVKQCKCGRLLLLQQRNWVEEVKPCAPSA